MDLILMGGALLLFCFSKSILSGPIVLAMSGIVLIWSMSYLQSWGSGVYLISDWILSDSISGILVFLVVVIMFLSFLCSNKDFSLKVSLSGFSVSLIMVSVFCYIFFMSASSFMFYIFFEASLIPTLMLILGWGYQPERLQAGFFMMIYTVSASMPLFFIVVWLWSIMGTDSMSMIYLGSFKLESGWFWVMIMLAFLVKLPVFLVHSWLPKAHVEAPVSGSMVLAGVLLKMGGYGLCRWFFLLKIFNSFLVEAIFVMSLWGGLLCSAICMVHSDLKALIAFSSIGHMSMVLGGLMSSFLLGWESAVCLMFAHGICSPMMFSMANETYGFFNSRSMMVCKGILKIFPLLSFLWFIVCVLNMGCPPSLNFISEVFLVGSILFYSWSFIVPLGFMCFLTAGYCLYLYCSVNHGGSSFYEVSSSFFSERAILGVSVSVFVLFFLFISLDYLFV